MKSKYLILILFLGGCLQGLGQSYSHSPQSWVGGYSNSNIEVRVNDFSCDSKRTKFEVRTKNGSTYSNHLSISIRRDSPSGSTVENVFLYANNSTGTTNGNYYFQGDFYSGNSVSYYATVQINGQTHNAGPIVITTTSGSCPTGGGGSPSLVYSDHLVKDGTGGGSGNDNGMAEPDERIDLDVKLYNIGSGNASGIKATLSTSSPYIEITDDIEYWDDIAPNQKVWCDSDFDFDIASNTPEGNITFKLAIESDEGNWNQQFSVYIHHDAPPPLVIPTLTSPASYPSNLLATNQMTFYWNRNNSGSDIDYSILVEESSSNSQSGFGVIINSNRGTASSGTVQYSSNTSVTFRTDRWYRWRIQATRGSEFIYSSYRYFQPIPDNYAPVLSSPSASPSTVVAGNSVTFRVTYTDQDNDPPNLYKLQYKLPGQSAFSSVNMNSSDNTYTNGSVFTYSLNIPIGTNPANGTYQFVFRDDQNNIAGGVHGTPYTFWVNAPSCDIPTTQTPTSITSNSARLRWNAASGAINYDVWYRQFGTNWEIAPVESTSNTYLDISNLFSSKTYEFRVKSNCSSGLESSWSSVQSFQTNATPCNTPTSLNVTNITTSSARLDWATVTSATSYIVDFSPQGGNPIEYFPGSSSYYDVSSLQENTTYEFRVKANCNGTQTSYSSTYSFTTGSSNNAPVLSNNTESPDPVTLGNAVTFRVLYRDADNHPPANGSGARVFYKKSTAADYKDDDDHRVNLTGASYSSYISGRYYSGTKTFTDPSDVGTWNVKYVFDDGQSVNKQASAVYGSFTVQAPDPILTISPSNKDVLSGSGSTSFAMTTNLSSSQININDNADWLSTSLSGNTLTANYNTNTGTSQRTATITVSGGGITKTVTVRQSGAAPVNNPPFITNISLSQSGNTLSGSFKTNDSDGDNVKNVRVHFRKLGGNYVSWYEDVGASYGSLQNTGNQYYTINTSTGKSAIDVPYSSLFNSTGTYYYKIEIKDEHDLPSTSNQEYSFNYTVPITPHLNPSTSSISNVNSSGTNTSFTIASNVSWTVSSNKSWITVSPTSGSNNRTVNVTIAANSGTSERNGTITVSGSGVNDRIIQVNQQGSIPSITSVQIGDFIFTADNIVESSSGVYTLQGNINANNCIKFSEQIVLNTNTLRVQGNGEIFLEGIPNKGIFGGRISLYNGSFNFSVASDILNPIANYIVGFKLAALPLKVNYIRLIPDGIAMGADVVLGDKQYGPNASLTVDPIQITKTNGFDVVGRFDLNNIRIPKTSVTLNNAYAEFNTLENCFGGGADLSFKLLKKDLNLTADIGIKNGGLNTISVGVGVMPGIPLGSTGFELTQGNLWLKNIVQHPSPPLTIGASVNIDPIGNLDVVAFKNVGVEYSFAPRFSAFGEFELLTQPLASGKITVEPGSFKVEGNLNFDAPGQPNFLSGTLKFGIKKKSNDDYLVLGYSKLGLRFTKPKNNICVNAIDMVHREIHGVNLPDVYEPETSVEGFLYNKTLATKLTFPFLEEHPIVLEAELKKSLFGNNYIDFRIGENFKLLNKEAFDSDLNNLRKTLIHTFENDTFENQKDHLNGKSLILKKDGRNLRGEISTDQDFILDKSYTVAVLRVEGETESPEICLTLPTGQIATSGNEDETNVIIGPHSESNETFAIIKQPILGTYTVHISGSETYQLDLVGTGFGPSLIIDTIENLKNNRLKIKWQDDYKDGNAQISWYYDDDNDHADGNFIALDISEDSPLDSVTWDYSELTNGNYYIYGIIEDTSNIPSIVYYSEPFIISKPYVVDQPQGLAASLTDSSIVLTWQALPDTMLNYLLYYGLDTLNLSSEQVYSVYDTTFNFKAISPGRNHYFTVLAVDTALNRSKNSNVVEVVFKNSGVNNPPYFHVQNITQQKLKAGLYHEQTLSAYDIDGDVLTFSLIESPEGLLLLGNTLNWTPNLEQSGDHTVSIVVTDNAEGFDTLSIEFNVQNPSSSEAIINFNDHRYLGLESRPVIQVIDPDANENNKLVETKQIHLYSKADPNGIIVSLNETGSNTGIFQNVIYLNQDFSRSNSLLVSNYDSIFGVYEDQFPEENILSFALFENSSIPNQLPTNIILSKDSIKEGNIEGQTVGMLSHQDADEEDTHTYSLVKGENSTDNIYFYIDDKALKISVVSDFEVKKDYFIHLRVSDNQGGFYEKDFTIKITDDETDNTITALPPLPEDPNNPITLYPNPNSGYLKIGGLNRLGDVKIEIYNISGVLMKNYNQRRNTYDISNLPSGLYVVKISSDGKGRTINLIKN